MVRTTIRMLIPLEKQSEALEILGSTIEQTQFEPGCVSCRIYRGVEDVRAVMLEELWMNDEDVQHHLRSDKYRKILLVIEMASEPPEIRFDTIAQTSGVETIEQARSKSAERNQNSIPQAAAAPDSARTASEGPGTRNQGGGVDFSPPHTTKRRKDR